MRKTKQIFTLLLLPVDAFMILAAFIAAYQIRAGAIGFPVVYIWPFNQYLKFSLEMLPIWLIAFAFAGLYQTRRRRAIEFTQILTGASLGAMAVVLWVFVFRSDFFSRLIVFYIWVLAIIFVEIGRAILGLIESNMYLLGARKRNLVLIGKENLTTRHIINQIKSRPSLGYQLYGFISEKKPKKIEINYLGHPQEFEKLLKKNVDEVIVTDTTVDSEKLFSYMRTCQEKNIVFKAVPAHAQVGVRSLQFDAFEGIPIIEFKGTPLDSWGVIFKRVFDIIGSIIALIILSPLIAIISILIKLTSKGPVIYRNTRIGNRGEFETLKFRTMSIEYCTGPQYGGSRAEKFENHLIEKQNIKKGSAVYKIANDPRITPIGRFLRKTSLDELPQFINVIAGNMSLVGPRPHQPKEVKHYTNEQRKLLLIKPGITGLAQISGRSDLTFDEEARLDIFYLENWSIWLDFYIILKTFSAVFRGKGTY